MSIKSSEDIAIMKSDYGITVKNFVFLSEPAKFIYEFVDNFGYAPDKETIELEFNDFQYSEGSNNLSYIADEFNKEIIRREILAMAAVYIKPGGVLEQNARLGLIDFTNKLESIRSKYIDVDVSHRRALDGEDALQRYNDYLAQVRGEVRTSSFGLGIEPIEGMIECLRGNLIGVFADTGIGKSFLTLRIAAEFFMRQEKVVVVSPELSVSELNYRCDSVLGYRMGYNKISNLALLKGYPGPEGMAEQYRRFLSNIGNRAGWINFDDSIEDDLTVTTIDSIILTEVPTLVVIDGVYMMDDEMRGGTSWERMRNICLGLKRLATKRQVVIVMVNHSSRESSGAMRAAKRGEIADGMYFARCADILLSLGEIEDNPDARELRIVKLRSNRQDNTSYQISFNVDIGDIGRDIREKVF